MLKFQEFKDYVGGIMYDGENDQLLCHNGSVYATIGNPYRKPDTYEDGLALEEKAEADDDVWLDLYNDYVEDFKETMQPAPEGMGIYQLIEELIMSQVLTQRSARAAARDAYDAGKIEEWMYAELLERAGKYGL